MGTALMGISLKGFVSKHHGLQNKNLGHQKKLSRLGNGENITAFQECV